MQKDARSLPPHVIRECAKNVAEREIKIQRKEFMELGILADWSENGTYRTLGKYPIYLLFSLSSLVD